MATDVKVPQDLWQDDSMEAVITNWLASDGATVKKGALLAEIMVEKSQFEVAAPADGVLKITRQADAIVRKGDVIGQIT
ncbi:lipoyl domain-containing protein [Frigidibacter sp. ROC022]|uniref:lipoyl domain-containing protein n=1 Tax=Frigidibacter sp. ROC022 TaxID=2971796 RepID=UPI00215A1CCD|nr:lipoyl domain-containing protein [Frigidibacter sp. ROC022]MCR8722697.1 lipoyl domain-containing protein [Frigidibacter sp. ROC022]